MLFRSEPSTDPEPKKKEDSKEESKKEPEVKDKDPEPQVKDDNKASEVENKEPKEDSKQEEPKIEDNKKSDEDTDREALRTIIKGMEDKIKDLTSDVELFKRKYEEEKELRESAEQDKIKIENVVKHDLIEKINDLRTSFGLKEKEIGRASCRERV